MPTVGARIRATRLARGMKMAELARAAGLSPSAISRIERDERDPVTATLAQVARALGVDPGTLIDAPDVTMAPVLARDGVNGRVLEAIQVVGAAMPTLPERGQARVLRIIRAALDADTLAVVGLLGALAG